MIDRNEFVKKLELGIIRACLKMKLQALAACFWFKNGLIFRHAVSFSLF